MRKKILVLLMGLLSAGLAFGQKKSVAKATDADKTLVCGTVADGHNLPVAGVKAFVYAKDSTIAASGYTDDKGKYFTNTLAPGAYFLKFIYPSGTAVIVNGFNVKGKGNSVYNLKMNPPAENTAIDATDAAKAKGAKTAKKK